MSSSCSLDNSFYQKQQFLALAQIGLLFAMIPYYQNIQRQWKQQTTMFQYTSTSTTPNPSTCSSSYSIELLEKFRLYTDIMLYSLVASIISNLFYLAFRNVLPTTNLTEYFFYVPLFVVGIICIGYSTDAFVKITYKIKQEPIPCKDLFRNARIFFILSLSISVFQAVVSLMITWNTYFRVENSKNLPMRMG